MKKALFGLAGICLVLTFSVAADAGDYHSGSSLVCTDCHVMHYSVSHSYSGGAGDSLGAGGPFEDLLKFERNDLCLFCHDGQSWAPDVRGANSSTTPVRQAGALTTGSNPYENWKGHTLGSVSTAPGGTWSDSLGLACVDCHDQHGEAGSTGGVANNAYRNLKNPAGNAPDSRLVTYVTGSNNTAYDVFQRSTVAGDHYNRLNIDLNEPNTSGSAYAGWCRGCHTDFHGAAGDANMGGVADGTTWIEWKRHPSAQVNIGATTHGHSSKTNFGGRKYRVQVMSPGGVWGTQGAPWPTVASDLTPTCVSCHKGHGNQNAFGLVYMRADTLGTGWTEEGDGGTAPRGLCKQCHSQGS